MLSGEISLIAIGASTGGFDALEAVLSRLPATAPPIVIAMHLTPGLPKLFASRMNGMLPHTVKEAESGDILRPGGVFMAPGWMHTKVVSRGTSLALDCYKGEKVNHVAPSADVLFESVCAVRKNAIGIILTGIGADGSQGLLKMRKQGAVTIGQNEATCTVYGMPKVAKDIGAVQFELPLNSIADKIISLLK